jgi:hypothetical protein
MLYDQNSLVVTGFELQDVETYIISSFHSIKILESYAEKFRKRAKNCRSYSSLLGRIMDCMTDVLMGSHRSIFPKPNIEFNSDLAPCDFWAFPTTKRELQGKEFRSDQRSAARFRELGGAL